MAVGDILGASLSTSPIRHLVEIIAVALDCVAIGGWWRSQHAVRPTTRGADTAPNSGVRESIVVVSPNVHTKKGYPGDEEAAQQSISDGEELITIRAKGPVVRWPSAVRSPSGSSQVWKLADDHHPDLTTNSSPSLTARTGDVLATGLSEVVARTCVNWLRASCRSIHYAAIASMSSLAYIGYDRDWTREPRLVAALDKAAQQGKHEPKCVSFGHIGISPRTAESADKGQYPGVQSQ